MITEKNTAQPHDTNPYRDPAFPVAIYTADGPGCTGLHWHEELQFTTVTCGQVHMQANGTEYLLGEGQAIFINRNCLHAAALPAGARYVSVSFPGKLLGFFPGSLMERNGVLPITEDLMLPACAFREEAWHRQLQGMLLELIELFSSPAGRLYEYRISMQLVSIWHHMVSHVEEQLHAPSQGYLLKQQRMRAMLAFIHRNYGGAIRLKDIADAAGISGGECCRCFQQLIRKSPNQYLISYRLARACELLRGTEKTVAQVACETGFFDASHFIHLFKRHTGKTPKEYRRG